MTAQQCEEKNICPSEKSLLIKNVLKCSNALLQKPFKFPVLNLKKNAGLSWLCRTYLGTWFTFWAIRTCVTLNKTHTLQLVLQSSSLSWSGHHQCHTFTIIIIITIIITVFKAWCLRELVQKVKIIKNPQQLGCIQESMMPEIKLWDVMCLMPELLYK